MVKKKKKKDKPRQSHLQSFKCCWNLSDLYVHVIFFFYFYFSFWWAGRKAISALPARCAYKCSTNSQRGLRINKNRKIKNKLRNQHQATGKIQISDFYSSSELYTILSSRFFK